MIAWNYRVFREANGDYLIREVFYAQDGSILSCTENAVEPYGQSLDELARDITWFKEALDLPMLTFDDILRETTWKRERNRATNLSHEQLMAELGLNGLDAVPDKSPSD